VYGVSLQSDIPLLLPPDRAGASARLEEIVIRTAPAKHFRPAIDGAPFTPASPAWCQYARLRDRSTYLRWNGIGEFTVSADGREIRCRRFHAASEESFQVYLVQRSLSFALVKLGFEPLHATVVVMNGRAVGLLGDSGAGKSSLAAFCLNAGDTLLTDDLLLLWRGAHGLLAYPGPSRIKLFPGIARRLFGAGMSGTPMNPDSGKLVMRLDADRTCQIPTRLSALYILQPPTSAVRHVRLEALAPRAAFLEILKHTFNYLHTDPDRLERQFLEASRLAEEVPVKRLIYPRVFGQLAAVREALLADAPNGGVRWPCRSMTA
jgi:hypothetical protein